MNKIKVHPLRAWRTDQGLTQTELARKIGYCSPGIIHGIEKYKLDLRISEVKKLCDLSEDVLNPWDFLEPSGAENG